MRKVFAALSVLLVIPAMAFANGTTESTKENDNNSVSMLHFSSPDVTHGDANAKAFASSMAAFRKENPTITVNDEYIPRCPKL
jgi:ABC-type glycerol-3-phosphate transport system substrate-binding protein